MEHPNGKEKQTPSAGKRRADHKLRNAVSSIESLLLAKPGKADVIGKCCNQLARLYKVGFGYSYAIISSDNHSFKGEFVVSYRRDESGSIVEQPNISTSFDVPGSLSDRLRKGHVISGESTQLSDILLPMKHDQIEHFAIIPLADSSGLHGIVVLCDELDLGSSNEIQQRVRPLVSASCCLLRASEKQRKLTSSESGSTDSTSDQLVNIIDGMINGVLVADEDCNIVACNTSASSLLGVPRRLVVGSDLNQYLPSGAQRVANVFENDQARNHGENKRNIWRGIPITKADGSKALVDVKSFYLERSTGDLVGIVMDDISERMNSVAEYQSILHRFQLLTSIVPVGIIQLNDKWEAVYVNDTWCEYSKRNPEENSLHGWLESIHYEDMDRVVGDLRGAVLSHSHYEGTFRLQSPLGEIIWVNAKSSCLYNSDGDLDGLIISINDVSEQLFNERKLRNIAEKDQLTNLYNRHFFSEKIEQALDLVDRKGTLALMFVDLDEFKSVNDSYGHDAGDLLLKTVSSRLLQCVRKEDSVARFGGDEFVILLEGMRRVNSIVNIADKIIDSLNEPIEIQDKKLFISCSIGISVTEQKIEPERLLREADAALYKSKQAGKCQYKFYTPDLDRDAMYHLKLRESVRDPNRHDFALVFQPQINAETGNLVGAEALSRWSYTGLEDISTERFIHILEESNLIASFTHWVLDNSLAHLSQWIERKLIDEDFRLSINISAKHFRQKDLASQIYRLCSKHCVNPRNLCLEVTETAFLDDTKQASDCLGRLKKMGFAIMLDDFGTGYSALAYLKDMPLTGVKMDRSFVEMIEHDAKDALLLESMITLAHALELKVVAEGVETHACANWLIEKGCCLHQGFLYSRPLNVEAFEKSLHPVQMSDNVFSLNPQASNRKA